MTYDFRVPGTTAYTLWLSRPNLRKLGLKHPSASAPYLLEINTATWPEQVDEKMDQDLSLCEASIVLSLAELVC
jgi:hypothetical protein